MCPLPARLPVGASEVAFPPQAPHKSLWLSLHLACGMDLSLGGKEKKKKTDFLLIFSQLLIHMLPSGE